MLKLIWDCNISEWSAKHNSWSQGRCQKANLNLWRFEIFELVIIHVAVFWSVMSRLLIAICWSFEWNICPHNQGTSLNFEKESWYEISINIYQSSRHRPKHGVEYNRCIRTKQRKTRDLGSGLNSAVVISPWKSRDMPVLNSYRLTKQSCRKHRFRILLGYRQV
jgi:hypothetical protein